MRISRSSVSLGALVAILLAAGIPALGQDKPESILPPGFGDPVNTPAPAPAPSAAPRPVQQDAPAYVPQRAPVSDGGDAAVPVAAATPVPVDPAKLAQYEMPVYARRSLQMVGAAGPADGALGEGAFGTANGVYLETLMRRLDAPLASRWLSIGLRRALVARVATPRGLNGADFAAERAWLLLRMGESIAARGLVQNVDNENYTPKMFQVAMQTALATGDPAALCPVADAGAKLARERGWVVARAICAGLAGFPAKASSLIAQNRNSGLAGGIDLLLAQKIAGTGAKGQQGVTIEWDTVTQLTTWRYGLATASGEEIPDSLIATMTPTLQSWRAQSPALEPRQRAAAAELAAVRGVFSNAALVDLYSAVDASDDQAIAESSIARDLRAAYAGADRKTRLDAFKQLWDEPKTADGKFARLILTAHAAARLPTDTEKADVDRLVAAMLTAGLDRNALRWAGVAPKGGDAWAMLALADPDAPRFTYSEVSNYSGATGDAGLKRRMLFAGLAGLGRLSADDISSGARSLDVRIGAQNNWTRAIGRAAQARQPGTVLLLAAIGMQTPRWEGVSPATLYHIVTALRAVGLEGEARMIAAEAIARL